MAGLSFAEHLAYAKVLLAGLKTNAEAVANYGIGADYISALEAIIALVETLNNEQESLKAQQIMKTTELNAKDEEFRKMAAKAKGVVKLNFDKSQWLEFGIKDKR